MANPLSFPRDPRSAKGFEAILRDFPFFGLLSRIRRSVKRQLAARGGGPLSPGSPDGVSQRLASQVAEIIRCRLGWPNANFLAQDPCWLLFCPPPFGMQDVEALLELSARFGVPPDQLTDYKRLLFGELLERIAKARQNGGTETAVGEGGHGAK